MTENKEAPQPATSSQAGSMMPSLEQVAAEAAQRAQLVLQQLTETVFATDSVALLATLSSLRLTRAEGEEVDVDAFAHWQAKLEFLAWLAATKPVITTTFASVDAALVGRVEELLEEYFSAESLAVAGAQTNADPEIPSLQRTLLIEAMHVRGEGTPEMVQFLARGLYSQHTEWFGRNLGFTCDDAIDIANAIFALHAERLRHAFERGHAAAEDIEAQWRAATERPPVSRSPEDIELVAAVEKRGLDWVVSYVGGNETFSRMREVRGFTAEELSTAVPAALRHKMPAFLRFFSQDFGTVPGTPSPVEFNPLVQEPLLVDGGRYFLFIPPLLWEAILNTPHYALIGDAQYRSKYDDTRAAWLEQQATEAFRRLWPKARIGWSLKYGPKAQRSELDGLVLLGNKLILIECKWKSLTLVARRGDSDRFDETSPNRS